MLPKRVDTILGSIDQLRPMPSNVTRLLRELEDPGITAGQISDQIGLDQALAALIMQMSNSALLGYGRTCTSIGDAVVRLGFKRIKSIVMASAASDSMKRSLRGYRLGAGQLWEHSLAVAVAAEWVAQAVQYPAPEEAYVTGLLHDMGKLMLDQYVLSDYTKIVEYMHRYRLSLWQVEEKLIGIDHAKVGGLMAEKWQFTESLLYGIRHHHDPSSARKNAELAAVVNMANAFASQTNEKLPDIHTKSIHPASLALLNISSDKISSLQHHVNQMLNVNA
jgi:putative nucleotidyltransferase with HDIG domain